MLLEAFVELGLCERGYKLVMIGTPDLKYTEFQEYYNGLSEEVKSHILIQSVPFPDLVGLYKNASLFVFPSYAEGFGIPPLEAVEYGCPVLTSNATAMAEFDFPKEMTFNPSDKEELKQKIMFMLKKPFLMDQSKIAEKFNWRKSSDVLYQSLIK